MVDSSTHSAAAAITNAAAHNGILAEELFIARSKDPPRVECSPGSLGQRHLGGAVHRAGHINRGFLACRLFIAHRDQLSKDIYFRGLDKGNGATAEATAGHPCAVNSLHAQSKFDHDIHSS